MRSIELLQKNLKDLQLFNPDFQFVCRIIKK